MSKTTDFDFELPKNLIATEPCNPRDAARMIVFQEQKILHQKIKNLPDFLRENDVIVFNDTKVIKAKIIGRKNSAKIEINLHQKLPNQDWRVFAKPAKKLHVGDEFIIADDFSAQIIAKQEDGTVDLRFNVTPEKFFDYLEQYGQMPLPPYIKRNENESAKNLSDNINYQTIFAKHPGAVAAPTAGLHFTTELLQNITQKNVHCAFVTLNVGAGTFLPVKSEFIQDHKMHSEYFSIDEKNCAIINAARHKGGRVIAVGTTSLRVLESAAAISGNYYELTPQCRETNIFIYPPYQFKMVDILLTNFHLPKSTLFMLICAFIGTENARELYRQAIEENYRFYSYGDACLLHRKAT